ncbi:hypothetical protein J8L98_24620, partial [Pseudoalteromonas sp. MMG013]|uniref:hypothetical protein n=1 Tax=Pseudoalteromonas sp. MMG013 TaxID=2822687 RepID=UPI001B3603BA
LDTLEVAKVEGDKFNQALALANPTKEDKYMSISFDMPKSVGYGFTKGNNPQRVNNLSTVVVGYAKDAKGVWHINSMYPSNRHVKVGGG